MKIFSASSNSCLLRITKVICLVAALCFSLTSLTPTFADPDNNDGNSGDTPSAVEQCQCADGSTGTRPSTAIIGKGDNTYTGCECGNGESITSLLNLIVNILSIGVGILGVVGISVTGVQYLTAGGNEEQTKKAKRRMFEIIIGLAVYAVMLALLQWILPSFDLSIFK